MYVPAIGFPSGKMPPGSRTKFDIPYGRRRRWHHHMEAASQVIAILRADPLRWHLLGVVGALDILDGWIGAGFVRNAIWDHLHGRSPSTPAGDVDVIWHDPLCSDAAEDRKHEATLRAVEPEIRWSVKNQARMHCHNNDAPYSSATDPMRCWTETATAVAVRRIGRDDCEVAPLLGPERDDVRWNRSS